MRIVIGANGWQHDRWFNQFYPDDLPVEWRLAYYSNEFPVVLVPFDTWSLSSNTEIEAWLAEQQGGFELFFELSIESGPDDNKNAVKKKRSISAFAQRLVKFSPIKTIVPAFDSVTCEVQEGTLVEQYVSDEKIQILRISSNEVMQVMENRHMIEHIYQSYCQFDVVYLFLDQALLDINVLKASETIATLLEAQNQP